MVRIKKTYNTQVCFAEQGDSRRDITHGFGIRDQDENNDTSEAWESMVQSAKWEPPSPQSVKTNRVSIT